MKKSKSVIKAEIKSLEKKLERLREKHDAAVHPHHEVEIQIAISNAAAELRAYRKLLNTLDGIEK